MTPPPDPPTPEGGAPMTNRAEEWRQRYLAAMNTQLGLVVYIASPEATVDGVRAILTHRETGAC